MWLKRIMFVINICFFIVTVAPQLPKFPGARRHTQPDNSRSTGFPLCIVYGLKVTSHIGLMPCLGLSAALTGCVLRDSTPLDQTRPGELSAHGRARTQIRTFVAARYTLDVVVFYSASLGTAQQKITWTHRLGHHDATECLGLFHLNHACLCENK